MEKTNLMKKAKQSDEVLEYLLGEGCYAYKVKLPEGFYNMRNVRKICAYHPWANDYIKDLNSDRVERANKVLDYINSLSRPKQIDFVRSLFVRVKDKGTEGAFDVFLAINSKGRFIKPYELFKVALEENMLEDFLFSRNLFKYVSQDSLEEIRVPELVDIYLNHANQLEKASIKKLILSLLKGSKHEKWIADNMVREIKEKNKDFELDLNNE